MTTNVNLDGVGRRAVQNWREKQTTSQQAVTSAETEALQGGLNGKKSKIKLNSCGTWDVKIKGEPTRTFSTSADAEKFLRNFTNGNNAKPIVPQPLTPSNYGSNWSKGWETAEREIGTPTPKIPTNQQLAPQPQKFQGPVKDAAAYGEFLEKNPPKQPATNPLIEGAGAAPKKKPYVTPEMTSRQNIYPTADGKAYGEMIDKNKPKQSTVNPLTGGKTPKKAPKTNGKGFWTSIKNACKGKKGMALLGAGVIAIGLGIWALGKGDKKGNVQAENPVTSTTPVEEQPVPTPVPTEPEKPEEPVKPGDENPADPTPVGPTPTEPVQVIVQNHETIQSIAKKYGVTVEQIRELNTDKIKQFHNAYDASDTKLYDGFLVGETIVLPAGTKVDANAKTAEEAKKDYEDAVIKDWDKFAPERHDQVASKEFQKKHNLSAVA